MNQLFGHERLGTRHDDGRWATRDAGFQGQGPALDFSPDGDTVVDGDVEGIRYHGAIEECAQPSRNISVGVSRSEEDDDGISHEVCQRRSGGQSL